MGRSTTGGLTCNDDVVTLLGDLIDHLGERPVMLLGHSLGAYLAGGVAARYTHVPDQHSTYGTKVIPTAWREAVAVFDEIFGNTTELPIGEHTTDTAGRTMAVPREGHRPLRSPAA